MLRSRHKGGIMSSSMIQTLSSVLSTLTIMSCLFLKVPQIMHIQKTKSAQGIYIEAMLMEIFSFTTVTMYNYTSNYSVMTYLEYPIILIQIYVLLYYTLKYKRMLNTFDTIATLAIYVFLVFAFFVGLLPKYLLSYILPLCTPVSGFAKVTYIAGMIRQNNADGVALATWIISVGTNLARLFTVFVDSGDITLMLNFTISASLSAGVLATALYYKWDEEGLLVNKWAAILTKQNKSSLRATLRPNPTNYADEVNNENPSPSPSDRSGRDHYGTSHRRSYPQRQKTYANDNDL